MIRISGVTSDDHSFDLTRAEPFEDVEDATQYAITYARCVSGTDTVTIKVTEPGVILVTAMGANYSEELRVRA